VNPQELINELKDIGWRCLEMAKELQKQLVTVGEERKN
jgi:hypothetical protein